MTKSANKIYLSAMLFLLGGCAYSSDALFPSLFGEDEQEPAVVSDDADVAVVGSATFEPVKISEGSNTGTFVGQKVVTFRNELTQLQGSISNNNAQLQQIRTSVVNNALQYHKAIGMIEAKLQVGTTPGNPQMFAMLEGAQNNIQVMNANANALTQLAAKVAADSANTDYLVNAIRSAYTISGAVDEDHRQLHVLENEAGQTSILMNSLLNEINNDISRQKQYINTASDTIVHLSSAIKVGSYGVNNVPFSTPSATNSFGSAPVVNSGSPLFAVKFNKAGIKYQDGLKKAVSNALSKKPSVVFDIVAVNPAGSSAAIAKNNATQIFQEMVDMGVNPANINLSAKSGAGTSSEVQIFVR
ncbi:MAG: hypothetical protein IJV97_04240 [Alphaproteobacteria bacterium]|nr:hypothetical protein [Alphaproteobacteria bacterium]